MFEKFRDHFKANFNSLINQKVAIAISGGVDSTVLTHLLYRLGVKPSLIHVNFQLRGLESNKDEQFVESLAKNYDLNFFSKRVETLKFAEKNKLSIQVAARELRYNFFEELVIQKKVDSVLTAHHLDDQLETVLINLSRGTGLKGLQGIPERRDHIYRPLLPFSRDEIKQYALSQKFTWREDKSNASNKYVRNALRNKVIPSLKDKLPDLMNNLSKSFSNLEDSQFMVDKEVSRFRESGTFQKNSNLYIDITCLQNTLRPKAYLFELLRGTNIDVVEAIKLVSSDPGKFIETESHKLIKDRIHLILSDNVPIASMEVLIDESDEHIALPNHRLRMQITPTDQPLKFVEQNKSKKALLLDAEKVKFPLRIRNWNNGDRIQPLGMKGAQKISDILVNHKVSIINKTKALVLESDDQILWLVGYKPSKHYKITSQTKRVIEIWLAD